MTFKNAGTRTPSRGRSGSSAYHRDSSLRPSLSRNDTPSQVNRRRGHKRAMRRRNADRALQQEEDPAFIAGPDPEYPIECQAIAMFMNDYQSLPRDRRLWTTPILFIREMYVRSPTTEAIHPATAAPALVALAHYTNRPELVSVMSTISRQPTPLLTRCCAEDICSEKIWHCHQHGPTSPV